ncbi:MAG: hypothetical protein ACLSFT_00110 [Ruminococcus callidus]
MQQGTDYAVTAASSASIAPIWKPDRGQAHPACDIATCPDVVLTIQVLGQSGTTETTVTTEETTTTETETTSSAADTTSETASSRAPQKPLPHHRNHSSDNCIFFQCWDRCCTVT